MEQLVSTVALEQQGPGFVFLCGFHVLPVLSVVFFGTSGLLIQSKNRHVRLSGNIDAVWLCSGCTTPLGLWNAKQVDGWKEDRQEGKNR